MRISSKLRDTWQIVMHAEVSQVLDSTVRGLTAPSAFHRHYCMVSGLCSPNLCLFVWVSVCVCLAVCFCLSLTLYFSLSPPCSTSIHLVYRNWTLHQMIHLLECTRSNPSIPMALSMRRLKTYNFLCSLYLQCRQIYLIERIYNTLLSLQIDPKQVKNSAIQEQQLVTWRSSQNYTQGLLETEKSPMARNCCMCRSITCNRLAHC